MKPNAFILNAGRGGLIDEAALIEALNVGQIAGAWLDVFADEPYSGPLCHFDRVILTPHAGSYTLEGRKTMELEAATNLLAGLGATPRGANAD